MAKINLAAILGVLGAGGQGFMSSMEDRRKRERQETLDRQADEDRKEAQRMRRVAERDRVAKMALDGISQGAAAATPEQITEDNRVARGGDLAGALTSDPTAAARIQSMLGYGEEMDAEPGRYDPNRWQVLAPAQDGEPMLKFDRYANPTARKERESLRDNARSAWVTSENNKRLREESDARDERDRKNRESSERRTAMTVDGAMERLDRRLAVDKKEGKPKAILDLRKSIADQAVDAARQRNPNATGEELLMLAEAYALDTGARALRRNGGGFNRTDLYAAIARQIDSKTSSTKPGAGAGGGKSVEQISADMVASAGGSKVPSPAPKGAAAPVAAKAPQAAVRDTTKPGAKQAISQDQAEYIKRTKGWSDAQIRSRYVVGGA